MIKRSTENSAKMSKPDTGDDSSLHEDALLSEEPDVLIDETTKGSENVTVSILQSLTQLNSNMAAMGDSLRLLHTTYKGETLTPKAAEPAQKRKATSDTSETGESSDADELLNASKRQKVVGDDTNSSTCDKAAQDDESDSLLDEIAQSLTDQRKLPQKYRRNLPKSST